MEGVESLKSLHSLSLVGNRIKNDFELFRIPNKNALINLKIEGNPIDTNPGHKMRIIKYFPNLKTLNLYHLDTKIRRDLMLCEKRTGSIMNLFLLFIDFSIKQPNFPSYMKGN